MIQQLDLTELPLFLFLSFVSFFHFFVDFWLGGRVKFVGSVHQVVWQILRVVLLDLLD